ncbi:hypothetical protein RvY_08710 [Ramazzottius varieornatus]|uniref:Uncharacterized protein n=1 Tax=Ramazzottius varieornatus TaxID=947166 RepID=A0A1D1VES9_RAMVA|nr:hypothetical protein RvY_08710 [Ramazzottius varieornatus]
MGSLALLTDKQLKERPLDNALTTDSLEKIMADYVHFVPKENDYGGYPAFGLGPYCMSKLAVNALTRVLQRDFNQDKSREDLSVNSCYPGYTVTGLTNQRGTHTAEEAAKTSVYLALLGSRVQDANGFETDIPRGQLVRDRRVLDWVNSEGCMKFSDIPKFDAKT